MCNGLGSPSRGGPRGMGQGRIQGYLGGQDAPPPPPPPPHSVWGTSKLHKEGKYVMRVCANMRICEYPGGPGWGLLMELPVDE